MTPLKPKLIGPILFAAVAFALVGCSTVEPKLPVGLYREISGPDFIHVSSNHVRVRIEGVDSRDESADGMTFEYVSWPGGRLFLRVARSVELTYGYPSLDYRWDGARILASDPKAGRGWEFSRKQ